MVSLADPAPGGTDDGALLEQPFERSLRALCSQSMTDAVGEAREGTLVTPVPTGIGLREEVVQTVFSESQRTTRWFVRLDLCTS